MIFSNLHCCKKRAEKMLGGHKTYQICDMINTWEDKKNAIRQII